MSDKEEFFELPRSRSGKRTRKRTNSGFYATFFWLFVLGFLVLGLLLVGVKLSGKGPALRRALITWLGGQTASPPAPEVTAPTPPVVERVVEKVVEVPVEKIVEKVVEVKPPLPSSYVSWKKVDVAKLWNGIPVKTEVVTSQGDTAVKERERDSSYEIEMKVKLTVPKPNDSAAELAAINEHLPKMLKDFDSLVSAAEVSPFYHHLYELKTERIQQRTTRIDELVSRHNLYDLETLLQVKHPSSGRPLLLAQGEMDTVSDGSDGDRWPELDDYISMSQHYQPFTSYGWAKRTTTPNPLLARWENKLREYEKEFAVPGLGVERNRYLRSQIERLKPEIADLKTRSYLIAEADPFIVIPLSFLGRRNETEFGPAIGDYAVVVFEDRLYPAIAGDAGPTWKFGEASLRIAREINAKASPYNRPVSDLKVTYLIFPGSADETKGPPNLEAWRQRCAELIDEIGGLGEGYSLHQWEDLIAKKKAAEAQAPAATTEEKKEEEAKRAPAPASETSSEETPPSEDEAKATSEAPAPTPPASGN